MAVDLADYVESLQRAVTPVGGTIPVASNWDGYLADAFWEARLDGFFSGYTAEDTVVTPLAEGGPDLDRRWISLIVMYAAIKLLTTQILNTNSTFRAKAGPVEFETQTSSAAMTEMLKQLGRSKDRLLENILDGGITDVVLIDALSVRALSAASYYGSALLTGD